MPLANYKVHIQLLILDYSPLRYRHAPGGCPHALYRCPANSLARLLPLHRLHTQGNQCWWNAHTSLKNNMLAGQHLFMLMKKLSTSGQFSIIILLGSELPPSLELGWGWVGSGFPKKQRQQPVRAATGVLVTPYKQKVDFPRDFDDKLRNPTGHVAERIR